MLSSIATAARARSPAAAPDLSAEIAPAASKDKAANKQASATSSAPNADVDDDKKQAPPKELAEVDARVRALYYVMQSFEVSV